MRYSSVLSIVCGLALSVGCATDEDIRSGDDTMETAFELTADETTAGRAMPDDIDFYRFGVVDDDADFNIEVRSHQHPPDNIVIVAYDASGESIGLGAPYCAFVVRRTGSPGFNRSCSDGAPPAMAVLSGSDGFLGLQFAGVTAGDYFVEVRNSGSGVWDYEVKPFFR